MAVTLQRRRWSLTVIPGTPCAPRKAGEFTTILTFSLSGLALFLFAIGRGWLGDAGYVTSLFLLLQ